MNLKEYLDEKRLTYREFAEKLKIHPQSLQSIAYGKKRPSLELAVKIEELTEGELTPKKLLDYYNKAEASSTKRKFRGKKKEGETQT